MHKELGDSIVKEITDAGGTANDIGRSRAGGLAAGFKSRRCFAERPPLSCGGPK